jgi:hypothetical protein
MLIEEVDHRRNHRKIEKKEETDSGVLFVSHQLWAVKEDIPCYASR